MSLVHFNSFSRYREATARHTGGINTFSCGGCAKFRSIAGRKQIPSIGRAKKWLCAECHATKQKVD